MAQINTYYRAFIDYRRNTLNEGFFRNEKGGDSGLAWAFSFSFIF